MNYQEQGQDYDEMSTPRYMKLSSSLCRQEDFFGYFGNRLANVFQSFEDNSSSGALALSFEERKRKFHGEASKISAIISDFIDGQIIGSTRVDRAEAYLVRLLDNEIYSANNQVLTRVLRKERLSEAREAHSLLMCINPDQSRVYQTMIEGIGKELT